MFAVLGVHCGPDITAPAAASLAGVPAGQAWRALAELTEASLIAEHRPGRHVMHDLVRGYAAGHAREDVGEARIREAIGRSLDHYLHTMIILMSDIPWPFTPAPPAPGMTAEWLAGEAELANWARAEHQVLLQATAQAAAMGLITRAWQIFALQAWFLGGHGYWADFQAAGQAVLAAAQAAGDQAALGWTHVTIGRYGTLTGAGAREEDRAHQLQALDHFRRAGDLPGQAWAHLFASNAYSGKGGDWAKAGTLAGQALVLFRQTGDRAGQGWALTALGTSHARLGNHELARSCAQQALELGPEGGPLNLARAWNVLGFVHSQVGEYRQAMSCYRQALDLAHHCKIPIPRRWLAGILANFGDACQAAGDLPAAAAAWQQALQIIDDLGMPDTRRIRAKLEQADAPSPPG
jgi:tetratricopeptide (TPR) repeat protein